MKWVLITVTFLLASFVTKAQSKNQPNSLKPGLPTKVYAPKVSKKKKSKGATYEARDKFYDRIDEVERGKRKNEKRMTKPQYSNFQYYGHRKPPKKRSPEKMRYCKVCGIRH